MGESTPDATDRLLVVIMILALVVPIVVALFDARTGAILVLLGLLVAMGVSRVRRQMALSAESPDEARRHAIRQETGHIIYVELLDEHGNELSPEEARAKLTQAQLQAGPRDTVIPIRSRPGSQSPR